MATLQGQEIKDTYQSLLKTEGNTNISSSLQTITDGQGNATALSLSTDTAFIGGGLSNNVPLADTNFYSNGGGTSGSQYFLYNSTNKSIYLNAWAGDFEYQITSSLTDIYYPGLEIAFIHTTLGLLTGSVSSSYFYNGEGDPLTIITLTTDPSNGTNDTYIYSGPYYPPNVYFNDKTYSTLSGYGNVSTFYSHAEGTFTTALGFGSHTEGNYTVTLPSAQSAHAEGTGTTAVNYGDHSEGVATIAAGGRSHTEGAFTKTLGSYSHAEGEYSTAIGRTSHAEGRNTTTKGDFSHAEGGYTITSGSYSHAEGSNTKAIGNNSHAEGVYTTAIGGTSHTEGENTATIGQGSHTEGHYTTAIGTYSHAEGVYTISSGSYNGSTGVPQHAEGRYNVPDTTSLLIVGNGTADNARANAFTITTFGTSNTTASAVIPSLSASLNFANDTAAAAGGVPIGGLYRSGSVVLVRLV